MTGPVTEKDRSWVADVDRDSVRIHSYSFSPNCRYVRATSGIRFYERTVGGHEALSRRAQRMSTPILETACVQPSGMVPPEPVLKGVTEIRVHGVGGSSPATLLDDPSPQQVSGDRIAGFYRTKDRQGRHVEAYSWGGLTSRSRASGALAAAPAIHAGQRGGLDGGAENSRHCPERDHQEPKAEPLAPNPSRSRRRARPRTSRRPVSCTAGSPESPGWPSRATS